VATRTVTLHVDFQDGWFHDRVVLSLNGDRVFDDEVTTKFQLGLATSVELPVPEGDVEVVVEAPGRGTSARHRLQGVRGERWVGITATDDGLVVRDQGQQYGYV
jgi:hypothetical protein